MFWFANRFASNHPGITQTAITIRWLTHFVIGHPWAVPAIVVASTFGLTIGAVVFAGIETVAMMWGPQRLRVWQHTWAFRRRWPALWANNIKPTKTRPVGACPGLPFWSPQSGLGFAPQISPVAAVLAVKPVPGQTLIDVQNRADALAAQHRRIQRIDVEYSDPTQTVGRLVITYTDVLANIETPAWN